VEVGGKGRKLSSQRDSNTNNLRLSIRVGDLERMTYDRLLIRLWFSFTHPVSTLVAAGLSFPNKFSEKEPLLHSIKVPSDGHDIDDSQESALTEISSEETRSDGSSEKLDARPSDLVKPVDRGLLGVEGEGRSAGEEELGGTVDGV
jgi:hypothetical protein